MTDEPYTKRLEDVRLQIGSIWESVNAGSLDTNYTSNRTNSGCSCYSSNSGRSTSTT